MTNRNDDLIDISERGKSKDGSAIYMDRRLFVQFLGFCNCNSVDELVKDLSLQDFSSVLYADINDFNGVGLLTMSEDPNFFPIVLRKFLSSSSFSQLSLDPDFTMLGRTYSFGYENDLEKTLISGPKEKIFDPELSWAIWYPIQRSKEFEKLPAEKQRAILGEHGKIGFKFGKAGLAKDIRLACHGLDKYDNDFIIGIVGKELYPLSAVIQAMRKTEQTSTYLESLGPFFIGKKIWQSEFIKNRR